MIREHHTRLKRLEESTPNPSGIGSAVAGTSG
jgi:hypothetical protein